MGPDLIVVRSVSFQNSAQVRFADHDEVVCGELPILPEPSIFATAASIPPLGLTHPVCGQYLRFAFWKSVQPTACFVRLASKGPEPA